MRQSADDQGDQTPAERQRPAMSDPEAKLLVGNQEWCALPGLGIPAVKARIDSGARTSALHAFDIQPFRRRGTPFVRFDVHPLQRNRRTTVSCEAEVVDRRLVKSSSGVGEKRYVVTTALQLGTHTWPIELTLTNRDSMGYRMLLGREAMEGRILVDPGAAFRLGETPDAELNRHYGDHSPSTEGLRIGILATGETSYSNQRILEAGEERGHEMRFLDLHDCCLSFAVGRPELRCRNAVVDGQFDAVVTRVGPGASGFGRALARHFEGAGAYTLNSAKALSQAHDAILSLQLLLQNGIPVPGSGFVNRPADARAVIEAVGEPPLVVRRAAESDPAGAILAESHRSAESVIRGLGQSHADMLIQQLVGDAGVETRCCLVIGRRVVATITDPAAPAAARLTREERRMAVRAAASLNLRMAGVDLARGERGTLLTGITPMPELDGFELATGKDIAGALVTHIEKTLGWQRPAGTG